MKKSKTVDLTITFDNEDARSNFLAQWLDGGLDGGGNLDWDTSDWSEDWMRVKGTGYWWDEEGILCTPEVEQARMDKAMSKWKKQK